jgi:hypothetical protein
VELIAEIASSYSGLGQFQVIINPVQNTVTLTFKKKERKKKELK